MIFYDLHRVFLNILSLSLSGALLGMLILLIRPLTGKYFSRKWNYYIWLLVIIRLLLPMQFTEALSGGMVFHLNLVREETEASAPTVDGNASTEASAPTVDGNASTEASTPTVDGNASTEASVPTVDGMTSMQSEVESMMEETSEEVFGKTPGGIVAFSLPRLLLLAVETIWILGVVTALCIRFCCYHRYLAFIKKDAHPVLDSHIMILAQSTAARMHMRKAPPVYESNAVSGPVTVGLWKPMIFLPGKEQNAKNFSEYNPFMQHQMVLHHEFIHVARRDLWHKWLYQFLLCIHWFNPFLYLFERKMNADCELACDEAVLAKLTEGGRKAYGNVLLDIAEQNAAVVKSAFAKSAFTTTFVTGKSELKERLNAILHYKRITIPKLLLSICVMTGTMFLTACGGVDLSQDEEWERAFWSDDDAYEAADSDEEENGWFWNDLLEINRVDTDGEAYRVYDDEALLSGEDLYDKWQAYNYKGGGNKITLSRFFLNGSYSLRIVYVAEETDIEVTSSFDLKEGKFKLVHIAPDGTVSTLNDTGAENSVKVTMPMGRNVIKIAGQAASLKNAEITFYGLKGKNFERIYHAEEDEYAGQVRDKIQSGTVEKDKVMESLIYMDEEDASEAFRALLEQGVAFDKEELTSIFIYSDAERSGEYLVEMIDGGYVEPLSTDILSEIMVYMEGDAKVKLLNALPEEDFFEGLMECRPFLNEKELEECLLAYIDAGGKLSYAQFDDIGVFLSRSTIEKMDERMAVPE